MIQFSNTTTKRGLVQMYEKELGFNYGDVSGNTDALLEFTARANNAKDNYLLLWAKAAGTWQGDDTNNVDSGGNLDYPIITSNLVSGQRDYTFVNDENSHRITDISKVLILSSTTATNYTEIMPIDELNTSLSEILVNTTTGVPFQYGKLSNGIFLDPIPDYSVSAGLKMIVNREGTAYTSTDTTKTTGMPAYDEYFYLKPAMEKASILGLSNFQNLRDKVSKLEGDEGLRITGLIQNFFSRRERDVRHIMTPKRINYI